MSDLGHEDIDNLENWDGSSFYDQQGFTKSSKQDSGAASVSKKTLTDAYSAGSGPNPLKRQNPTDTDGSSKSGGGVKKIPTHLLPTGLGEGQSLGKQLKAVGQTNLIANRHEVESDEQIPTTPGKLLEPSN